MASRQTEVDPVTEAEAVRDELAEALKGVDITLPSLGLDAPAHHGYTPVPLIDLGRSNIETARRLTAAVRAGGSGE